MIDTVRLLIIGAGKMGKAHIEAFKRLPEVEIVGITSKGGASAKGLAEQYHIPNWGTDWQKLAMETQASACVVTVGHLQTEEVVEATLNYGLHTLAEKPVSLSGLAVKRLAGIAHEKGLIAMAAVNRRFFPTILQGLDLIRFYGKLRGVTVIAPDSSMPFRAKGTYDDKVYQEWLKMNTIHAIDLLRLAGGNIKNIARVCQNTPLGKSLTAVISFESGALGTLVSHNQFGGMRDWKLLLHGDGIEINIGPLEEGMVKVSKSPPYRLDRTVSEKGIKPGLLGQAKAFVESILHTKKVVYPASDLLDHSKTLELIEQLDQENSDLVLSPGIQL